jgi:hypothetical protein
MNKRSKGKHVNVDMNHPQPIGFCDRSGFVHMRKDLIPQMEWRGDSLEWTGLYVGKDYLDFPNEQLRAPDLVPDPVPVENPRGYRPSPPALSWPDEQQELNNVRQNQIANTTRTGQGSYFIQDVPRPNALPWPQAIIALNNIHFQD